MPEVKEVLKKKTDLVSASLAVFLPKISLPTTYDSTNTMTVPSRKSTLVIVTSAIKFW